MDQGRYCQLRYFAGAINSCYRQYNTLTLLNCTLTVPKNCTVLPLYDYSRNNADCSTSRMLVSCISNWQSIAEDATLHSLTSRIFKHLRCDREYAFFPASASASISVSASESVCNRLDLTRLDSTSDASVRGERSSVLSSSDLRIHLSVSECLRALYRRVETDRRANCGKTNRIESKRNGERVESSREEESRCVRRDATRTRRRETAPQIALSSAHYLLYYTGTILY